MFIAMQQKLLQHVDVKGIPDINMLLPPKHLGLPYINHIEVNIMNTKWRMLN